MIKNREPRTTQKKEIKSKKLLGVTDITREIMGVGAEDNESFGATKKKVERTIGKIKQNSDISKDMIMKKDNFNEFSKVVKNIVYNPELDDINNRISKGKASIEDYDKMIEMLLGVINERVDTDKEKILLNQVVKDMNDGEVLKIKKDIKLEVDNLYDNIVELDRILHKEGQLRYYKSIKSELETINDDMQMHIGNLGYIKTKINSVRHKYPHIEKLEKIDLADIETLGVNFIGEVLDLPTIQDIQDEIDRMILSGELELIKTI